MNRKVVALAVVVLAVVAGSGVYGWGGGAFWPCESLGRLIPDSRCTQILALDQALLQGADATPEGNILIAAAGDGEDPDMPSRLLELTRTGDIVRSTELSKTSPEAQPRLVAVSDDGERVAVSFIHGPIAILDRSGLPITTIDQYLPSYMAFDSTGKLMIDNSSEYRVLPSLTTASVFDLTEPTPTPVNADDVGSLYGHGFNAAMSSDGQLFAQVLGRPGDSGIIGVRVGVIDQPLLAGRFFGADLRAGCTYAGGNLSFSPFGAKLAVEFDCPERWGTVSSALLVWDYEADKTLLTLPTIDGFGHLLWLDDQTIIADRYNYAAASSELFRIAVP